MKNFIKFSSLGLIVLPTILHSCKKEELPTLSTSTITNITATSATGGGYISSDGNADVKARGVCWGLNANPITSASKTGDGVGTGQFVSTITGLSAGSTYHVRAYATNKVGTAYGADLSFTTHAVIPTVSTAAVSSVTHNSALCGGNIINNGGATITTRGICWGTSANPTITGSHTIDGTGLGSFTNSMNCLTEATTYYVRAYATNIAGTAYGDQQSFTTTVSPITFNPNLTYGSVTDIEGNCYKTILIGDQTWMAENLKTSKYNDGTPIPNITNNNEWSNLCYPIQNEFGGWINSGIGAFSWYNNDSVEFDNEFGKLYNWIAVNTGKLCPDGWRIPALGEWERLIDFTEYNPIEYGLGSYLMETGADHWDESLNVFPIGVIATNETGFTALPGGIRASEGVFSNLGFISLFWASDYGFPTDWAFKFKIPYNTTSTPAAASAQVGSGLSVRCVKD